MLLLPALVPIEGQIGGSDCEYLSGGPLSQPVNALSSAAYVLAAIVVLARTWRHAPDRRPELVGYAALLALIGIGSVIYHGPQWQGARLMHDWPIPVLLLMAGLTPLVRRRRGLVPVPGLTRGRLWALGGVGAAAGLSYALGRTGSPMCDPDSLLQLHGAWHALSAVCFVIVADILYRPAASR